jgi:PhnB protein
MHGFAPARDDERAEQARRIFDALGAGGSVPLAMQQTFWAETRGMLTDRFGAPWRAGGGPAPACPGEGGGGPADRARPATAGAKLSVPV